MKFRQKAKLFLKSNYIYIIMVALIIFRIILGYGLGAWYKVDYGYDDVAMFKGLSVQRITHPTEESLIKNLAFSLFLGVNAISGIPYTIMTGILWSITALVVWFLIKKMTDKKWVQLFGFVYVLFLPIAFESWGGLRIYRNAIIAPCIILTFSLLLFIVIDIIKGEKVKKSSIITSLLAGIMFSFTYFLKEDGIWLKLTVAALMAICACILIVRLIRSKNKSKPIIKKCFLWLVVCIIPFVVLSIGDKLYKGFNQMAFGVYETNTRTEGELGKFVYSIDSPNRTVAVWAPYDAIEAAFNASPTLSSHPGLLEAIRTTEWFDGDIIKNPIPKDFLTWVIRTELVQEGLWTSEKDVSNLFKQVNSEIQQAFEDGTLKKATGRIQIVSSIAGYSMEDIKSSNLMGQLWWVFEDAVWLKGYEAGYDYDTESTNANIERVLNMNHSDINTPTGTKKEISKVLTNVINIVYRVVNTVLIIFAPIYIITQIIFLIKNLKKRDVLKKNKMKIYLALTSLFFFGITFVYTLATAWFFLQPAAVEFYGTGRQDFIFYNVGVPGLLTVSFLPALPGVVSILGRLKTCCRPRPTKV